MLDHSAGPKPPQMRLPSNFAASQGANILLAMAVVLFVIGCGALALGHTTLAALLILVGLLTVIIAARLGGLAMLTFEVVKVKVTATFGPDADGDGDATDDSSSEA